MVQAIIIVNFFSVRLGVICYWAEVVADMA
jgi:hypothetical protein